MIIIFISIIIWNVIISIFGDSKNKYFACGLIGFVPKKKQEANLNWVKLIMSYNVVRGIDSCGIYINEEFCKGVKDQADIRVLISEIPLVYDSNSKNKIIIAHTRKSTRGKNEINNCHPFIETNKEGRSIILAHNGTITNINDLAKKYNVDTSDIEVDSNILARIIINHGYDVLGEYQGGAALLFTYSDEPNVMYCFKGASKEYYHQKDKSDERPLYIMSNNDGVYLSSLSEPLDACSDLGLDVFTVQPNSVIRIENNKLDIVHTVNRDTVNCRYIPEAPVNVPIVNRGTNSSIGKQSSLFDKFEVKRFQLIGKEKMELYNEISYSMYMDRYLTGMVYFMGNRYYSFPSMRGLDPHGIPEFHHASPSLGIKPYLMDGEYRITKVYDGMYRISDNPNDSTAHPFTFCEGVMIHPNKLGKFIKKDIPKVMKKNGNPLQKIIQLSSYSVLPITFSFEDAMKLKNEALVWYHEGKQVKEMKIINPAFTIRRYTLNALGSLSCIETSLEKDIIVRKFPSIFTADEEDEEDEVTIIQNNIPESKVKIYSTFYGTDVVRYIKDNSYESTLSDQEDLDGIAQCNYYIDEYWGEPLDGHDILKDAIAAFITIEQTHMIDSHCDIAYYLNNIYTEGLEFGTGFLDFMNLRWGCSNFKTYIENEFKERVIKLGKFTGEDEEDTILNEIMENIQNQKVPSQASSSFEDEPGNEGFKSNKVKLN